MLFRSAIKEAEIGLILAGAERYRDDPNRVDTFTAHPATWLNSGRWNDAPLPQRILSPEEKKAKELAQAKAWLVRSLKS